MMRLRVSSIAMSINKAKLEEIFEEYGDVNSIRFLRGVTGENTIAFVEMKREREALEALEALHGEEFGGLILKVEISHDHVQVRNRAPIIIQDDDDDEDDDDSPDSPVRDMPSDDDLAEESKEFEEEAEPEDEEDDDDFDDED